MDLVVSNIQVAGESGPALVERISKLRPAVHAVYMCATADGAGVRIRVMLHTGPDCFADAPRTGLIEAIFVALGQDLGPSALRARA
jgi:hypothetical protein